MMWTKRLAKMAAGVVLAALALAAAGPAKGGSLGADTIALFPKETGEFAYADLKKARTMKWFPALQEQMLPERFKQFEKFLASAGVDPNTQVEELAWALVPQSSASDEKTGVSVPNAEEIVGIALGSFNPESTGAYFKQQKLSTSTQRGFTLYAFGSGVGPDDLFFFFIDSNKAAFGHRALLEKMIEVRFGAADGVFQNEKMSSMINEANGSGMVWAVLDSNYTRLAMQQLAPEVQQFSEAVKLVQRMQSMIITVTASSGIDGKFQAVCGTTQDANTLSQLIQAALLYKKYQTQKENADLAQLLDQASVAPSGDRLVIRMAISDDQMTSLIKNNTFAFKM